MAKLCPFKKAITTRTVDDTETVDEEFCLCDEKRCMAYFPYEIVQCALIRRSK